MYQRVKDDFQNCRTCLHLISYRRRKCVVRLIGIKEKEHKEARVMLTFRGREDGHGDKLVVVEEEAAIVATS